MSLSTNPSPTPWPVSQYSPSEGADAFHNLPRYGSTEFPADNMGDHAYWQAIGVNAGLPLACFFVGILFYWLFLCCRNGCCSCFFGCCGPCRMIRDFCFGCGCKQLCCPDVSEVDDEDLGCCECKKDENSCIHSGLCMGKPWVARTILIGVFITLGLVNLEVDNGLEKVRLAFDDLVSITNEIGDLMKSFYDEAVDLGNQMTTVETSCDGLEESCASIAEEVLDPIKSLADSVGSAATSIQNLLDGLDEDFYNAADRIDNSFRGSNFTYTRYAMLIGALFSVVGFLGALCVESKNFACRFSSCVLACTSMLGIVLLFVLSIAVGIELALGQVMGDFCIADPATVMVEIAADQLGSSNANTLEFFLQCTTDNPFESYSDTALTDSENITDVLTSKQTVMTSDYMCCNNIPTSLMDDVNDDCDFYNADYNPGCNTNGAVCNLQDGDPGVCAQGGGCSEDDFSSLTDTMDYVLSDAGPIQGILNLLGCENFNKPLLKLFNSALCTNAVDGLYILFRTHMSVLACTYVALFILSFLRQSIRGTTCSSTFFQGTERGVTEFRKPWEVDAELQRGTEYDHFELQGKAKHISSPERVPHRAL